jgi:hypothetical protein
VVDAMKSWRLDPILGEKIKLKDSDALSEFSLQVERAALRGSGVIQLACQLWNGQPQLTRHCAPSIKKELDAVCQDILACAPELDPVDLSRVLAKLDVAAGAQEPRGRADASDEAPHEQLSLSPPGFVCVALDEEGQRVYVTRSDDGALDVVPSVVGPYRGETVTHVPPPDLPWALPRAAGILEHYEPARSDGWAASLLTDVEAYLHEASDLGGKPAELLLSLYVASTYVPEFCDYYAEIVLEAEPERGKTRAGQAAIFASRHGVHVVGIREANLLRDADHREAALFIDIMKVWQSAERNNCTDILLGRFEKGATVERVLNPDAGPFADTTFFGVFGPTLIATNEPIHRILDTRSLRIDPPLSERRFSGRLTREAALPLVEKLMAWRALVLAGGGLVESEPPADGRLGDVLRPLRQVLLTMDRTRAAEFDAIVSWQQKRRVDDLSQSWEAGVVDAVWACRAVAIGGWLPLETVLTLYNGRLADDKKTNARWLGGKIRTLGCNIQRRGHDNVTSIEWNDNLMQRLRVRYGLVEQKETQTSAADGSGNVSHVSPTHDNERDRSANVSHEASNVSQNVSQPSPNVSQDSGASTRGKAANATRATHATRSAEGVGAAIETRAVTPCPACGGTAIYRLMGAVFCTACWPDPKVAAEHVRRKRAESQDAQKPAWEDEAL